MDYFETVKSGANYIKQKINVVPDIAIVLGSGLGDFVKDLQDPIYIDYKEMPGFPVATAMGHVGRFVYGKLSGKNIIAMQGRFHLYEGYDVSSVVMPIRVLGMLGVLNIIFTNASGGVDRDLCPGDLLVMTDHISLLSPNPLKGENIKELGIRFPDMSQCYNEGIIDLVEGCSQRLKIPIKKGTYMYTPGPNFETPAEIEFCARLGADAIGMSTVPEVIVAANAGMKILGISLVCNMAAGILPQPLTAQEVFDTASEAGERFNSLMKEIIKNWGKVEEMQGVKEVEDTEDGFLGSVLLDDDASSLNILDQSLLPNEKKILRLKSQEDIWEAINTLKVRGAPAIGIAAAYGVYLGVKGLKTQDYEEFFREFKAKKEYLASSRPTAVNLFWALNRMEQCLIDNKGKHVLDMVKALKNEANDIRLEDERVCKQIGENALTLLKKDWGLLTHCNAGGIATAKYGTALSPMYLGKERGYNFKVFASETRPLLQGARLTTWELMEKDIDVTLLCDNMVSSIMKEGKIQAVLVGCDRVCVNGDTANKIGTSGVAILAKHYNIPFFVCAPISTIDIECQTGDDIHIEHRKSQEVTHQWYERKMAPDGVKVYNPAFDVTDNSLITAIITEKKIILPPFADGLKEVVGIGE